MYYIFLVYISSLRYQACNAYAPYCHLWPAWLYNFFPHYVINGMIMLLSIKCVFWFSLQLVSDTFPIQRRTGWGKLEMYIVLHVKYPLLLSNFNETWILSAEFKKCSNIKFHENPSSGSLVVPCRQTYMTKLIVTFCSFTNMPKSADLHPCSKWH
jgi:hypothetical protein